ncbi:MAG: tripartite tricarboxylate transporter substrate-binding protein [Burkholderiales bacterium]
MRAKSEYSTEGRLGARARKDIEEAAGTRSIAPKRLAILPDVPTVSETLPGVAVLNWYGALIPAGVPRERVGRLHGEMVKAMHAPDIHAKLASHGFDANGTTPEQFGAFRKAETARWGKVIEQAGVQKR